MKIVKRLFLASLFIVILGLFIFFLSCAPQSSIFPGDFPDSRWVYEGEIGTLDLIVNPKDAERGFFYGSLATDYGNENVEFVFDTISDSVVLLPLDENAVEGEATHMSEMILRGSFKCTEEKFIISSVHYGYVFGGKDIDPLLGEEVPKIKLIFERVK